MNKIKIKNGEELNKLINALGDEIVKANVYHRLLCDIRNSVGDNAQAFNESNTFWALTIQALNDAKMIRLCRIYDQNSSSLSLVNLLYAIRSNSHLFEEQHFRERLKDNAFVDSLAQTNRVPPMNALEADTEYASERNPLVKKLIKWRGHIMAHSNANVSLGAAKVLKALEDDPLSQADIENLLDTGFAICNRYSGLYQASSNSRQMIGHDDYLSLLKFVNLGIAKWNKDIDREIEENT
jgi:AbiU2